MATVSSQSEDVILKLSYKEKVPVAVMKDIIGNCLNEKLTGFQYDGEKCNEAAKQLSDTIRMRLKGLGYDRYKYIVQVLIGERREQGMHFGTRCFWDSNTDNQASENFTNVRFISTLVLFVLSNSVVPFFFVLIIGSHILRRHSVRHLSLLSLKSFVHFAL